MGKKDRELPPTQSARDQAARDAADALTAQWKAERLAREAAEKAKQQQGEGSDG